MTPSHKYIRALLRGANRSQYDSIVREAKLSPLEIQCLDLFILKNETQIEIAARINLSERSVRLYLSHIYDKIAGCRLLAGAMTDANHKACYAISVGGDNHVWNDTTIPADTNTGTDPAAVHGTMAIS